MCSSCWCYVSTTLGRISRNTPIFIRAVEAVIADEMFDVESENTSVALKTALAMQEWWKQSPSNLELFTKFSHTLCEVKHLLCLLKVYSTVQEREDVGSIPSFTNC